MKNPFRKLPKGLKSFARRMTGGALVPSAPTFTRLQRPENVPVLQVGLIGLGRMGQNHANVLRRHPYFSLAALTSASSEKRSIAAELGGRWFDSTKQMIESGVLDAVVIATPHWQHAELAVTALRAGLHVVCEKPITVTVTQADAVLKVARETHRHLAVVCQTRFEPIYQRVKELLTRGDLGPILRCDMVETFWRSDAYYRSNIWRGTWKGEGGGVVINQAPHVLDRYIWFCGMPESVTGFCDTALHKIEVEDSASALFRHADGAHGHIHVSTNECPWLSRTVIACDRGRITIDDGLVRVARLCDSIRARTAASAESFSDIECDTCEWRSGFTSSVEDLLGAFYENFALSVAGHQPLLVPGKEAVDTVELANAILLSSAIGRTVALPLDRANYDTFIAGTLIRTKMATASSP